MSMTTLSTLAYDLDELSHRELADRLTEIEIELSHLDPGGINLVYSRTTHAVKELRAALDAYYLWAHAKDGYIPDIHRRNLAKQQVKTRDALAIFIKHREEQ